MVELLKRKIIKTKPVATDLFFSFKDVEVSKDQYEFLRNRLDNYMFCIHEEYLVESETIYDEPSETLLMGITIIIPDRLLQGDAESRAQIFVDLINGFPEFYENEKKVVKK